MGGGAAKPAVQEIRFRCARPECTFEAAQFGDGFCCDACRDRGRGEHNEHCALRAAIPNAPLKPGVQPPLSQAAVLANDVRQREAGAPVQLKVVPRDPVDPETCRALCLERGMPRELLLQQRIEGLQDLIQCFHCEGTGSIKGGCSVQRQGDQTEKVKEVFKEMDLNGDGKISKQELTECLEIIGGASFTQEEVLELVRGFDRNGDGEISFEEFVDWIFMPGAALKKLRQGLAKGLLPKYVWLYEDTATTWAAYDKKMALKIETAYSEGVGAQVLVKGPSFSYIVDLDSMTQTNLKTGKTRRVMRLGSEQYDAEFNFLSLQSDSWQGRPEWSCDVDGKSYRYEDRVEKTLEATKVAFDAGELADPTFQMKVYRRTYEFNVKDMTQRNVKSEVLRTMMRLVPQPPEDEEQDQLMRCPSTFQLPEGICWVCRGSGKTSCWLEPIPDAERFDGLNPYEGGDLPDCLVCYCDTASYGVSTECQHVFCDECIRGSLEAILDVGQFPAFCPMCRAEQGPGLEVGRINGAALSFLQQRGIITKAFQYRFLKQQAKALEGADQPWVECLGKCGHYLIMDDSYAEQGLGRYYPDPITEKICVTCGQCPICDTIVCPKCEMEVKPEENGAVLHQCADFEGAQNVEPDEETKKLMATIGKRCPVCEQFIEKNEGCDWMMCGTKSHGFLKEVIRNGGCGIAFLWSSLQVNDDPCGWKDLDDSHKKGRPVTALQLKGKFHPKCARPECNRFKSVDRCGPGLPFHNGEGTQGKNNGGEYCCDGCARDGSHSVFCHNIRYKPW